MVNKLKKISCEQYIYIFIVVLSLIITLFFTSNFSVLVVQGILSIITMPFILTKSLKSARVYIIIYVLALFFVFLFYYGNKEKFGIPYFMGGSDDLTYENNALTLFNLNIYSVQKAISWGILPYFHNSLFYVMFLTWVIKFSSFIDGYSTFLPRIINVFFLLWSTLIFEYLLHKHTKFTDNRIHLSLLFFAIMPSILFINSFIFRDTFNLLQILSTVYLFDKMIEEKNLMKLSLYLVVIISVVLITFYTRKNSLYFSALICCFTLVQKFKQEKLYILIPVILPILSVSGILEKLGFGLYNQVYTSAIISNANIGLSKFIFEQPLVPFGIILRGMYILFSPFPDFWNLFLSPNAYLLDFGTFLIYCGVVIQILISPFLIKRVLKFDWISISFVTVILGIITTTFTFRQAILYYPFMAALGVDGYLSTTKKNRFSILIYTIIIASVLVIIYRLLKISRGY